MDLGPASNVETPAFPKHRALIDVAFARLGWSARDFHGYRFKMLYPPMSTIALLRWPLPKR